MLITQRVVFAFNDDTQRARRSNVPTGVVKHWHPVMRWTERIC
jgi:hypothetical protein